MHYKTYLGSGARLLPAILLVIFSSGLFTAGTLFAQESDREFARLGRMALKNRNYDKAIDFFTRAIEVKPKDARYYNDRGVALRRSGKLGEALEDYSKALAIQPNYVNALNNRGVIYLKQGEFEKAIEDLSKALKRGRLKSKLYLNRGVAYARIGDHRKAIRDLEKATDQRPRDHRAFLLMGGVFEELGKKKKALKAYRYAHSRTKDPKLKIELEEKIAALEKVLKKDSSEKKPVRSRKRKRKRARYSSQINQPRILEMKIGQKSGPGVPGRGSDRPSGTSAVCEASSDDAPGLDSLSMLNDCARQRTLNKMSPRTADIYLRGKVFHDRSDLKRAFVRYEDALKLAKRNKNTRVVAWCLLEMGRVYALLGDNAQATPNFERALMMFQVFKADDEIILAMMDLASATRAMSLDEKADGLVERAKETALKSGRVKLSKTIEKMRLRDAIAWPPGLNALPLERSRFNVKPAETSSAASRIKGMGRVGRGPVDSGMTAKKKEIREAMAGLAKKKGKRITPAVTGKKAKQPDRELFGSYWV
ncbi:tetratricopeptide repeat protein [Thermodesulfobacteriota bacterium]